MARRVTVFSDKVIRGLDVKKNSLTGLSIRQGTATNPRACIDDITNIGDVLAPNRTKWLQNASYVVGDLRVPPNSAAVPSGHTGDLMRCTAVHTSSNIGTAVSDWAIDYTTNGYWERVAAATEGQPTCDQTKVAVYNSSRGISDLLGYSVSHDRPITDAIMDDMDEMLQPDPTLSNEQLIYTYEDIYGNLLNFISAQTITSPIARLIGVKKE